MNITFISIHNMKSRVYLGQGIQEWTKYNLWKTAFKAGHRQIYLGHLLRQTISLPSFSRLSFTNFSWSIIEYLDTFKLSIIVILRRVLFFPRELLHVN